MTRPYAFQPPKCKAVENDVRCAADAYTHGYCNKHWQRVLRHGHTGIVGQPHKHKRPGKTVIGRMAGNRRGNAAWRALSDKTPELTVGLPVVTEPEPDTVKTKPVRRDCTICWKKIKVGQCWNADGMGYRHRWCMPHQNVRYPVCLFTA